MKVVITNRFTEEIIIDEESPSLRTSVVNRKLDLRRADLRNADLRRADLWNADLWNADLRRADLRNADLWDADLQGAHITQEQISDVIKAYGIRIND